MTVTPGRHSAEAAVTGGDSPIVAARYEPKPPRFGPAAVLGVVLPAVGIVAGVVGIHIVATDEYARALLRFAVTYILPFGILWAGPLTVALGVDPLHLTLLVAYFDNWFALFWIWNLDHLMRFRVVRRMVDGSVAKTQRVMQKRRWLAGTTVPGLTLFIGLPIPGTGMFSGIVLGKLIAMRGRWIYFAAMVGTTTRVAILTFSAAGAVGLFSGLGR